MQLNFGEGNAKLDALAIRMKRPVYTFSLLSGWTCPYAKDCNSRVVSAAQKKLSYLEMLKRGFARIVRGKRYVIDGPDTLFRCFSASQEGLFPNVYASRAANMKLVELASKSVPDAAKAIVDNLPKSLDAIIRIHVGGDFQTKAYFQSWLMAAHAKPDMLFYAYTKSLPFWIWARDERLIPENFILTASYGGYKDSLIESEGLRSAKVVFSESEARKLKLPIDHDDYHAACPKLKDKSFALLLHGVQPKGSLAAEALKLLKGKGSYGKKGKQ